MTDTQDVAREDVEKLVTVTSREVMADLRRSGLDVGEGTARAEEIVAPLLRAFAQAIEKRQAGATLLERYEAARHAEYELEQAVVDAFGGLDALWFHDWYFDTYDASVELLDSEPGREPKPHELAALAAAGIRTVFISPHGAEADERAGRRWFLQLNGEWTSGACSARTPRGDNLALLKELRRDLAASRQSEERLRGALARTRHALCSWSTCRPGKHTGLCAEVAALLAPEKEPA